ncbi:MAG: lipoyl(octanoyl) transferase [Planctomycetota bacterium]
MSAQAGIESPLHIIDCGLAEYREVLQLQHRLREKRSRGEITNTVLIVEHPAVITLGASQSANKLLSGREDLAQKHIDVVDIRRGGGTTAHNPGQLVFYPILNLRQLNPCLPAGKVGISEYIRELESIGVELLEQLGVHAERQKGYPGLWVTNHQAPNEESSNAQNVTNKNNELNSSSVQPQRHTICDIRHTSKIASIGVRVSKFITYHGMAINIQNDLSIFEFITPCGLDGVEMTSALKETGKRCSISQVKEGLSQLLIRHFS